MVDNFSERIDHLIREVGTGYITAGCEVNQPYAQNQHQTDHFRHPHGGRSHFLGGPLMEHAYALVESLGRSVITPFGSRIFERMGEISEEMAGYVLKNAPKETGRLSLSGSPWVRANGIELYRRPPIAPREEE
jgi:hypothetical protein